MLKQWIALRARSNWLVKLRISLTSFVIYLRATLDKMAVGGNAAWDVCGHAPSGNFEKWK